MEDYLKGAEAWVWRYLENTRNYPGYHFTARPASCESLVTCIERLRADGEDRRTLPLAALRIEDERKVSGGQRFHDYRKLVLASDVSQAEGISVIAPSEDAITITFNDEGASRLVEMLHEVRAGCGDHALEVVVDPSAINRKHRNGWLWYWPCFGHHYPIP